MATVTAFTAERSAAIESQAIIDGEVVGNDLILTRFDDSTINAGNVRGIQGIQGPVGEVTQSELDDAIAAAVATAMLNSVPVGVIADYIGITAPTNWLGIIGQTIVNGQTIHPNLWGVLPASMKSGSSIVFPDSRGRVSTGYDPSQTEFDAIGEVGGSKSHTLTQAQLPAASITIDPPNTAVAIVDPQHTHTLMRPPGSTQHYYTTGAQAYSELHDSSDTGLDYIGYAATGITASVNIAAFQSGNLGSGGSHPILQPYIVFMKIIKAV